MGSGQAGIYQGLGQGISNAGQAVMQALYMAQQQKLQQQQLGIQQQAQNRANVQQQQEATLQGFVDPNQVQPSPSPNQAAAPPDTSGILSPVGGLTGPMPGVLSALQGAARSQAGQGGPAPQIGGAPGPTNAAAQTGQLGGYDPSRYIPAPGGKFLDVTGAPAVQRQIAVMKAMQDAETNRMLLGKQIPEAINPQAENFAAQQQTQRLQNEATIASNRLKEMEDALGITQQRFGQTVAGRFEKDNQQLYDTGDAYRDWQTKLAQAQSGNPADFKAVTASFQRLVDQSKTGKLGMLKYLSNINPSLAGGVEQTVNRWSSGQFGTQDLKNMDGVAQAVARESSTELDRRRTEEVARHSSGPGAIPGYNNIVRPSTFEGAPVPAAGPSGGSAANVMRWLQTP